MTCPIQYTVEVFSPEPAENISRAEVREPRGEFYLIIPRIEGAHTLALFSSPLNPAQMSEAASELARFGFRTQRHTR